MELYGDEKIKFNYLLEIDILRNSSQNNLGVLRGAFYGFGSPKDALLTKTICYLSLHPFSHKQM